MITCLVTGAPGWLSNRLLQALAASDRVNPRALSLPDSNVDSLARLDIPLFRGDLRDPQSLGPACAGVDVVVHMAAVIHPRKPTEFREVNVNPILIA